MQNVIKGPKNLKTVTTFVYVDTTITSPRIKFYYKKCLNPVSKTRELQPTPKNSLSSYRFNAGIITAIIWVHLTQPC